MQALIGREKEIKQLQRILASRKSEFVALYGRRRVGKTFLVREFFSYTFDFHLTGLANADTNQQLVNFHVSLQYQGGAPSDVVPKTWFEAFQRLIRHMDTIESGRKKVLFFDELPWLDTPKSDFLMALEHFWNSWATNRKDIILITCGSAASWMIHTLLHNHGGLHNRVTERIKVLPFDLRETELLLRANHSPLNRYQICQIYMVTGGIPFYLEAIKADKSAAQNIEELCFRQGGLLVTEFHDLFKSLFKNSDKHEAIVVALSSKLQGLTRQEIAKLIGKKTGGGLTRTLAELEESGFISTYRSFPKKKSSLLYRLSDFYSMFYLKFIKENTDYEPGTWASAIDHPAQRAWAGFAFEQICLAHIGQIKKAIGIEGVLSSSFSWRSKEAEDGAQIDLLLDRRDQVVTICEVKFSINEYALTKDYAQNLRHKIGTLRAETATKKAIFLTLITANGLKQNEHSLGLVQNVVTLDDLFL